MNRSIVKKVHDKDRTCVGNFPDLFIQQEKSDPIFFRQFVKRCTGNNFVPHPSIILDYQIVIEFKS